MQSAISGIAINAPLLSAELLENSILEIRDATWLLKIHRLNACVMHPLSDRRTSVTSVHFTVLAHAQISRIVKHTAIALMSLDSVRVDATWQHYRSAVAFCLRYDDRIDTSLKGALIEAGRRVDNGACAAIVIA